LYEQNLNIFDSQDKFDSENEFDSQKNKIIDGSALFNFFFYGVSVFFLFTGLARHSLFRVLIFRVGFEKNQWFFLVVDDVFEHFRASQFCFVNNACVILLAVVVSDWVLVVIEDAASE
jgi:hypothetical protein